MFDLPDPFGPEMVVNPSRSGTRVTLPNDLKLSSSISLILKRVPQLRHFETLLSAELDYTLHLVSRFFTIPVINWTCWTSCAAVF